MNVQKRKGVKDIKTHAGTITKTFLPHEAYMRISTLEMERVHRLREMESAQKRIKVITDRLEEIDIEKNNLINQIKAKTDGFSGNVRVGVKKDSIYKDNKGQLFRY